MSHILGIDVGGTFTDFVAFAPATRDLRVWKTLSTPGDPSDGIVNGLTKASGIDTVDHLRFGTTVATNAILERTGANVAYVTTRGFKDVPFIQRGKRKSHYDITWIKSKPLVKRRNCFEIEERITPREGVYTPLNEEQAREVAKTIAANDEIEAVAICLLCSFVDPDHERRVRDIFFEHCPQIPVSISYDLLPKWKEHERSSTTIADAYVKPLVAKNLETLQQRLTDDCGVSQIAVIKSNGGEMTLDAAREAPIQLSLSGPTGGVVGAKQVARLVGIEHLVTLDMGGTSTDVSTVVSGRESFTTSFEIEFGVPIQIPMIDIRTMGAGGGSIAWIDKGGLLRVGPHSAGAVPGPACYAQGGVDACATDANVVLGRINPENFLGGEMRLAADRAREAVAKVASQIDKPLEDTALGIVQIANNNMVGALRMVLTERGLDPRDFTLLAFGGAGPVHVSDLMELANIPSGIVPNYPGQFSAFGFITTDARVDLERSARMTSKAFNREHANTVMTALTGEAIQALKVQGYDQNIELYRSLEMRYLGQNHELEVPIGFENFNLETIATIWEQFHTTHKARFNFDIAGETIELMSIKITAVSVGDKPQLPSLDRASGKAKPSAEREVIFDDGARVTPVYQRDTLRAGHTLTGPVLIEEPASVTVVRPEHAVRIDETGNILIGDIAEG